jgi:hypothetical protein
MDGNPVTDPIVAEGNAAHELREVLLSPVGRRVVVMTASNEGTRVLLDGKTVGVYPSASLATFSPDSRRLAFLARRGDTAIVVLDGA